MKQVMVAITQLANALLGGWADESLSSRAWRLSSLSRRWLYVREAIDLVFRAFGQREHCAAAWRSERERAHLPPGLR